MNIHNYIFPFCIYHYIDIQNNTFMSFLRKGNKKGCDDQEEDNWHFAGRFYAVDPSIIPRPNGLQIFAVKQRNNFPFDIESIEIVQDLFNIINKNNQLYDIIYVAGWTKPVPYTTPLFLHGKYDHVFVSYDPDPPPSENHPILIKGITDEIGSISSQKNRDFGFYKSLLYNNGNIVSPIYVLSDKVFVDGPENIKFQCIYGSIIPYNDKLSIKNLFLYSPRGEPLPLNKQIVDCNETNLYNGTKTNFNLEETIKLISNDTIKQNSISNFFIKKPHIIFYIVLFVFIFVVIMSIIIFKRR